jgi:carbonic anhydrase
MKPSRAQTILAAVFAVALFADPSFAQQWSYEGETAPERWGTLDPKFVMCRIGKNQSPIDIDGLIEARLETLKLNYSAGAADIRNHGHVAATGAAEILNNGHTVQVNYAPGSTIIVDGRSFELQQFHFHSPSEHRIHGKSFPLEAHLVHADKAGNLAVVAILFAYGAPNPFLSKLWDKMPPTKGDTSKLAARLNVVQLLRANKDYYRFNGSLTTPPCTEGVRWLVMKSVATVSESQVEQFAKAVGHPNNRPLQAVNARPVLK